MTPAEFRAKVEILNYALDDKLTDEQIAYAKSHILPHIAYWHNSKKVLCMDCGKTFAPVMHGEHMLGLDTRVSVATDGDTIVCPHCGARLEVKRCRKTSIDDYFQMATSEMVNGIQVKRVFECYLHKSLTHTIGFSIDDWWYEVMRIWSDPDNPQNELTASLPLRAFPYNSRSPWARHNPDLAIRRKATPPSNRYYIEGDYASVESIPVTRCQTLETSYQLAVLNAIRSEKGTINLSRCTSRIFRIPMIETLVKAGRVAMAAFIADAKFTPNYYAVDTNVTLNDYVHVARICLRNDYHPADIIVYFDYIAGLKTLGRDLHNAHYICPTDLMTAHQEVLEALRRRAEAKEAERNQSEAERIASDNKNYLRDYKAYLGIAFGEDKEHLHFHVLGSVAEFKEEGDHMHHCVYRMGYYKHPDSLILSCRDKDGKRLATIELNLRSMTIVQTRAACNKVPPHLELINQTVMQHIDEFRQAKAAQMALTAPTADEEEELEYCPAAVVI